MCKSSILLLTLLVSLLGTAAATEEVRPEAALRDYEVLTQWRYQVESIPVPQGGIGWREDTAAWQLDSGRIWLQEPTSGGAVSGDRDGDRRLRVAGL